MKLRKFVNIEIEGQDNIGVIDLGEISLSETEAVVAEQIHKVVNEKLIKALESHFDYDIEIIQLVVTSIVGPIKVNGKVRIIDCDDKGDCSIEEVSLVETWIY